MASLSSDLFSELSSRFFGILTGPNASIYIDVLDLLDRESPTRGDALDRAEVLALIDRVLDQGNAFQTEADELPQHEESAHPASQVLRRLIAAKWLEEDKRSDYQRTIYVELSAQALLAAFRQIVSQNMVSFTGKLRLVCDKLSTLRYDHSRMDLTWDELKESLVQVRSGLRELRQIRKQVERYAQRQLKTATIAEALNIIYDEFSRFITQQCYRELIHARLPERLREAMAGLTALEQDDLALQKLRDDCLRNESDPVQAMTEVLQTIEELSLVLGDVEPTADRVDSSTADFARRSRSRLRYIQDIGSARRQQVKTIFDYVRERLSKVRLTELEEHLDLPSPLLSDTGLIGMSSLAHSRRQTAQGARSPVATPLTEDDRETSLREMEKNLRNALRLDRANRFVDRLGLKPGETAKSGEMRIQSEDDILDVISCLVFASSGGASYRLATERDRQPHNPVPFDLKAGFNIEQFAIEKK
jgi:Family of unknown function (DUF5716)